MQAVRSVISIIIPTKKPQIYNVYTGTGQNLGHRETQAQRRYHCQVHAVNMEWKFEVFGCRSIGSKVTRQSYTRSST